MKRQIFERSIHGRDRRADNSNVDENSTKDKKVQELVSANDESEIPVLFFEQIDIPRLVAIVLFFYPCLSLKSASLITTLELSLQH